MLYDLHNKESFWSTYVHFEEIVFPYEPNHALSPTILWECIELDYDVGNSSFGIPVPGVPTLVSLGTQTENSILTYESVISNLPYHSLTIANPGPRRST